ncbi:uncharacterized protein LOC135848830 [Planococcus citri]|uniref:uncharacterized protein LOC135848830 n=1 Tax=Planococcus citri TaxID=170843 RepID=UPI0031F8B22E
MSHHVDDVEILDSIVEIELMEEEKSENQCSQLTTSNHMENVEIVDSIVEIELTDEEKSENQCSQENVEILDNIVEIEMEEEKSENQCSQENVEILDNIIEIEIDEEKSENQCSQLTMSNHVENVEILGSIVEIKMVEEKPEYTDEEKSEEEERSKDSDDDSDEEDKDTEEQEEDEEEEEDYYYRKRRWDYYDDHVCKECKKCKNDNSYGFLTINPVILTNVPKLMDMASVTVAATLWNHVNIPRALSKVTDRCAKSTEKWNTLCRNVIALSDQLPVPRPIAEHIAGYVRIMTDQIPAWVSYHYRTMFLKYTLDKFVYSLVYHIAWYPTGAINCVQTARNMMTSLRLSDVEKFIFLSVYCLKDEMDRMSSSLYSDNIRDYPSFQECPMIFYWYCFYRNKLFKISQTNGYDPNLSIDVYMLRHSKVDNWSAKEYFFDRLNLDEQVREAIWLIDRHDSIYQKAVMLKLNEIQREHVYMERATQIIMNYTRPRIDSRFILQTWFEARNLMSQDDFLTIFRELLSSGVEDVLLTEIWTSANDDFKQHVVGVNDHEIVRKVLTEWKWRDDFNEFVFVLLHDSSSLIKKSIATKTFFNTYCERLISNSKPKVLLQLLEFCLPDANDLAQFKMNFVSNSESKFFNTLCEKLLTYSQFQELTQLLEFFLPDAEDSLQFKMNLVNNSSHTIIKTHCKRLLTSSKLQELDQLLKFCLPDADHLAQYKRNFVYGWESHFFDAHCEKLLTYSQFQELTQLLEFFLLDAEESLQFKMNLVNNSSHTIIKTHCERLLISSKFQELDQLLGFCLPDADHLAQYKRNFVYGLESNFFDAHCEKLLVDGKFQEFDQLLKFCLPHVEDFHQFKMNFMYKSNHKLINTHCENLLMNRKFQELDRLLEYCLAGTDNLAQFKVKLVRNSEQVRKTCLKFYSTGDLNGVNYYLNQLLVSYPDVIVEYKKNLITSSDGFTLCVSIMDASATVDVLNMVLEDSLTDSILITEYKKNMIFSPEATTKLLELLNNKRLDAVQICIDRYLTSADDKKALKKQLIGGDSGDITKMMQTVLRNNDESYLQTVLIWCFGNENAIQEFKRTLPLNAIFIKMLKDCVFNEYNKFLTQCDFKWCQVSDFNVLDRFLNWYFQSPDQVKEFKMKVIHSYSKIDMFQTFLRGNRGDMQLRVILKWFFKNDTAEIAKFKKLGGKITQLV